MKASRRVGRGDPLYCEDCGEREGPFVSAKTFPRLPRGWVHLSCLEGPPPLLSASRRWWGEQAYGGAREYRFRGEDPALLYGGPPPV